MNPNNENQADTQYWHDTCVRCRNGKAVTKLYRNGMFLQSVIIPTVMYPLNGPAEVFTFRNCIKVTDSKVLEIFDQIPYQIGRCYTNAEAMTSALIAEGYSAQTYAGWYFTSGSDTPIHHCWTVLDGQSVLDLADDLSLMCCDGNIQNFRNAKSRAERIALNVDFQRWASRFPNQKRCMYVGEPTPFTLYVGCPCSADEARKIYNALVAKYPNHPCHPKGGINPTQKAMVEAGLMDWAKGYVQSA